MNLPLNNTPFILISKDEYDRLVSEKEIKQMQERHYGCHQVNFDRQQYENLGLTFQYLNIGDMVASEPGLKDFIGDDLHIQGMVIREIPYLNINRNPILRDNRKIEVKEDVQETHKDFDVVVTGKDVNEIISKLNQMKPKGNVLCYIDVEDEVKLTCDELEVTSDEGIEVKGEVKVKEGVERNYETPNEETEFSQETLEPLHITVPNAEKEFEKLCRDIKHVEVTIQNSVLATDELLAKGALSERDLVVYRRHQRNINRLVLKRAELAYEKDMLMFKHIVK